MKPIVYRITLFDKARRWREIEDAARDLLTLYDTPAETLSDGTFDIQGRGADISVAEARLRVLLGMRPAFGGLEP